MLTDNSVPTNHIPPSISIIPNMSTEVTQEHNGVSRRFPLERLLTFSENSKLLFGANSLMEASLLTNNEAINLGLVRIPIPALGTPVGTLE